MTEKVKQHLIAYAKANDWTTSDTDLIEILTEGSVIYEAKLSEGRWWNNVFRITKIDGMYIGYNYAQANRDESVRDLGWDFDPATICEVRPVEKMVTIYEKVNPAGGQSCVNNMLHDPNVKAEEANEQATEAAESAAQDAATGATESAEEGGAEG